MTAIHNTASTGFGAAAETYAKARPDYPAALDRWLREDLALGVGKSVLDLGAGTGKFTPRLLATGAEVTAVEPVEAMRERFARDLPEVTALAGTAEAIPAPDKAFDAVVCAQAFHWFASPEALAEIHRVLRPGGVLGLVWNTHDVAVPWVARLQDLQLPYEADTPRVRNGAWRKVFPAAGFGPLEETRFDHVHSGSSETVIVERLLSTSFIGALPEAERNIFAARVREAIAHEPALTGKTLIDYPYLTLAYAARRL